MKPNSKERNRKMNYSVNIISRAALAVIATFGIAFCANAATSGSIGIDSDGWDKPWTTSVSVNRGQEHTFWVSGLTTGTAVSGLYVEGTYTYTEDGEKWEDWISPTEWTETYDEDDNVSGIYMLLTADDWDYVPTSVKSVKFTVTVDGSYDSEDKSNNKFTFNHAAGRSAYPDVEDDPVVIVIPPGAAANPYSISATTTSFPTNIATCGGFSASVLADYDNEYHIIASLTAGRKYFWGYTTTSSSLKLEANLVGNSTDIRDEESRRYAATDFAGSTP